MRLVKSLASFGHDFQTKIFKCIILDKVYGESILEMLKDSYFSQDKFKLMLQKIRLYHILYQAIPNYVTLKILVNSIEDDYKDLMPQVLDLINNMLQDHPADLLLFVKKLSLNFCKNQLMKDAIIDSVLLLNLNNMLGIWDRMTKVLKITLDGDLGLDMNNNYDYVMLKLSRRTVSTGYKFLDLVFDGGVGKGELRVIMAPTGGGKSQFLVNIRRGALMQGKVVIYYSFLLQLKIIAARLASLISGIPINSLHLKRDLVIKSIRYFYDKTNSKFITKLFPTKSVGPSSLRAHIHKLRANGINPNMIIVDYADLMKPIKLTRLKRTLLEDLYLALRLLAGVLKCPVWTATQTNRSALLLLVIGAGSISLSFGKLFVADQVLSLSRTTDDKIAGSGKLHVIKNRAGQLGLTFSMAIDTSRCLYMMLRKLSSELCGQDTNQILRDFKQLRLTKITNKMQRLLKQFFKKKLEEK